MRFPGHRLCSPPVSVIEPSPNSMLRPNQTTKESKHARITQSGGERRGRHVIGALSRSLPRSRADHRAGMQSASPRPSCRKSQPRRRSPEINSPACVIRCAAAPAAAVTARNGKKARRARKRRATRASERQQPDHIEAEMRQIGVNQRIGDEGPDVRAPSAGQGAAEQDRDVVARRDERKQQQKSRSCSGVSSKIANDMNEREHRQRPRRSPTEC